jgi:hypothetical protein
MDEKTEQDQAAKIEADQKAAEPKRIKDGEA